MQKKQATKQHLQENPIFEKKNIYEYVSWTFWKEIYKMLIAPICGFWDNTVILLFINLCIFLFIYNDYVFLGQ